MMVTEFPACPACDAYLAAHFKLGIEPKWAAPMKTAGADRQVAQIGSPPSLKLTPKVLRTGCHALSPFEFTEERAVLKVGQRLYFVQGEILDWSPY